MITWSVIANIVHQRVAEPALDQLNRTQKTVSILKQLKKFGIKPDPPPDFDGCYVHTLVEYGIHAKEKYRGHPLKRVSENCEKRAQGKTSKVSGGGCALLAKKISL